MSESSFEQVFVCGNYLPPQSSIQAVMSRIGKGKVSLSYAEFAKANQLFCDLSNNCIPQLYAAYCPEEYSTEYNSSGGTDPEIIEYIRLNCEWLNLLKIQAELLQRDFHTLVQCLFVISWHSITLGDVGVINLRFIAQETTKMLNVYNRKKPFDKYSPSWNFKERKPHLLDYPDFAAALEYFSDFSSLVLENTAYELKDSDDKETRKGVTLLREIQMEMSAIDLARVKLCIPLSHEKLAGFCSNCMTNYLYDRGASGRCQRPQCIRAYNTSKTLKSQLKKKVEKKWLGSKKGICKCGNIDEVNDKNLCFKCSQ